MRYFLILKKNVENFYKHSFNLNRLHTPTKKVLEYWPYLVFWAKHESNSILPQHVRVFF